MYRFCIAAAAALLVAGCSKAPEDVTARYTMGGQPGAMIVKAASNGDSRVEMMGSAMVHHQGADYLIAKDPQGEFAAKVDDFVAVSAEAMRASGFKPAPLGPQPDYTLVKQGEETVAGIKGDLWKVEPPKGQPAPPEQMDAVISSDPAYAHVGKALNMQTRLATESMAQMRGGVGSLEKRVQELLGKGMVLRFGKDVQLEKIEKTPFDAKVFALPKVLDRAALKARLESNRAAKGPPPVSAAPAPAPTQSAK